MSYDSFYLVPRMSIVESRSHCDTSVMLGGHTFSLPIMPSNMSSVVDFKLCAELARNNYFYVMHRFCDYSDIYDFVVDMDNDGLISSISVGVKQQDYDLVDRLINAKLDYITLDIAHVDAILGRDMIKHIKKTLPNTFLIAGNVGSVDGAKRVESWGADALKVGIGNGSKCLTTPNTAFHCHPAVLLQELQGEVSIPIIADGSIYDIGDICKTLVLGADMCMIGGMLSGFDESPGETFEVDGELCKIYAGSTANNTTHIEGASSNVPLKGSLWNYLDIIGQNLRSSISYAGGNDLRAFNKVEIKFH